MRVRLLTIFGGKVLIKNNVDFNALEKAINNCIKTHDSFRSNITLINNEIKQYFSNYTKVDIPIISFNSEKEADAFLNNMTSEVFNILDNSLFRFKMFKLPNNERSVFFATLTI